MPNNNNQQTWGLPTKADHLKEMLLLEEVETLSEEEEEVHPIEVPLAMMVKMDQ